MTLHDALTDASTHIARRDAEVLAAHVLQRDRAWMLAHPEAEIAAEQLAELSALVARRAAHEPLQYLTGVQEFFGLPLRVTRDVLIPRPETELVVEEVIAWAQSLSSVSRISHIASQISILDIGAGSGAIAIALKKSLPEARVLACDVSEAALAVARENAARLGAEVEFRQSDLLAAYEREIAEGIRFDAIVSNPPYVALADAETLDEQVVAHEPHLALFAGDDGLAVYRRLIPAAHAALRSGGLLAMEFGFGQREALQALFAEDAWRGVRFVEDYAAIPRIVLAEKR